MKKIIRLTESELKQVIENSVRKILREDVLGDNWHEREDDVMNNYEPFETQFENEPFEGMSNEHDWGVEGEEQHDPTHYDQHSDAIGWNDDEAEGYEEDFDWYRDDVMPINYDPSDGDLYGGRA